MSNKNAYTLLELVIVIILLSILVATAIPRLLVDYNKAHEAVVKQFYVSLSKGVLHIAADWSLQAYGTPIMNIDGNQLILNSRGHVFGFNDKRIGNDSKMTIQAAGSMAGDPGMGARVCADIADWSQSVMTMSFYPSPTMSYIVNNLKEYNAGQAKPRMFDHTFAAYSASLGSNQPYCVYVYTASVNPVYVVRYYPNRERPVEYDKFTRDEFQGYFTGTLGTQEVRTYSAPAGSGRRYNGYADDPFGK